MNVQLRENWGDYAIFEQKIFQASGSWLEISRTCALKMRTEGDTIMASKKIKWTTKAGLKFYGLTPDAGVIGVTLSLGAKHCRP